MKLNQLDGSVLVKSGGRNLFRFDTEIVLLVCLKICIFVSHIYLVQEMELLVYLSTLRV